MKNKFLFSSLTWCLLLCAHTYAQPPALQWQKTIGSDDNFEKSGVILPLRNGYFIGGTSRGENSGDKKSSSYGHDDFWLVRLNASGQVQWERSYGGPGEEELKSITPTASGGFLLGGDSFFSSTYDAPRDSTGKTSPAFGQTDYWIVQIDSLGNKLWERAFGGDSVDMLSTIIATRDGGFLLAGSSSSLLSENKTSASYGGSDYWIIKIDADGKDQWQKSFGGTDDDFLHSAIQSKDGSFVLCGYSNSSVSGIKTSKARGNGDGWILKLDEKGTLLWQQTIGNWGYDFFTSLTETKEGGYIVGATTNSSEGSQKTEDGYGQFDYWIVKLSATGVLQWQKTIGGKGDDFLEKIYQTKEGGYLLSGTSDSPVSGNKTAKQFGDRDFWIVKTDSKGNLLWQKSYGGTKWELLADAEYTKDNGYVLFGISESDISGNKSENSKGGADFWVVKLKW